MFRGDKVFDGRTPSDYNERTLADHKVPVNSTLDLVMWAGNSAPVSWHVDRERGVDQ